MSADMGDASDMAIVLGSRIRAHRSLRRMSVRTLADQSGTSASFISQLERGRTGASIGSLVKIAEALGVTIGAFFDDTDVTPEVLRRQDRPTISAQQGVTKTLLTALPAEFVEVYGGYFAVGASTGTEPYSHGDSREVFVVLLGELELMLGESRIRMAPGDSIEYRTSTPHGARNVGEVEAEVLWIVSPPSWALPDAP